MEKSTSKVISSDEGNDAQQWRPPSMDAGKRWQGDAKAPGPLLTAAQLELIQKQAYDEGFEQGKKEGFEFGHREGLNAARAAVERLETLLCALNTPFKQLDDQVEQELVTLAIAIVRQLVRREVKTDPAHILGVVREALELLPVSSRNIRLVLHPEDAELVRKAYAVSETELAWKIVEDPVCARGGCKVLTDSSQVDATLESRLAALINTLLGGERDADSSGEEA